MSKSHSTKKNNRLGDKNVTMEQMPNAFDSM